MVVGQLVDVVLAELPHASGAEPSVVGVRERLDLAISLELLRSAPHRCTPTPTLDRNRQGDPFVEGARKERHLPGVGAACNGNAGAVDGKRVLRQASGHRQTVDKAADPPRPSGILPMIVRLSPARRGELGIKLVEGVVRLVAAPARCHLVVDKVDCGDRAGGENRGELAIARP